MLFGACETTPSRVFLETGVKTFPVLAIGVFQAVFIKEIVRVKCAVASDKLVV